MMSPSTPTKVDASASELNSNDVFVLVTPAAAFMWVGQGSSGAEKHGAQQLCDILGVSASELAEGGEAGKGARSNRGGRSGGGALVLQKPI